MEILIMAGTSDANRIIKSLKNKAPTIKITATTVTPTGAKLAQDSGADKVLSRPLNREELIKVLKQEKIDQLVDATHPYASEATLNGIKASDSLGIPYLRFERPKTELPPNNLIHKVSNFPEGVKILSQLVCGKILNLAGLSTIKYLTELIEPHRIVVRVLPSTYSIGKCLEKGIPPENIIAMQGTYSKDFNRCLMEEYQVDAIITKDSGDSGGTPEKIAAALEMEIPIITVQRPEIPELQSERVFSNVEDLLEVIRG